MTILIFGDSLAWGAFDLKGGGWVNRLKMHFMPKDSFVYDLSISGNTSQYLSYRIHDEIDHRLDMDADLYIIIAVGINDSSKIDNEHRVKSSAFTSYLREIDEFAKRFTNNVFYVSLTNVVDDKCNPVAWDDSLTYNNQDVFYYNSLLKETVASVKSKFIDIVAEHKPFATVDGVHLTPEGHQRIFETVLNRIERV